MHAPQEHALLRPPPLVKGGIKPKAEASHAVHLAEQRSEGTSNSLLTGQHLEPEVREAYGEEAEASNRLGVDDGTQDRTAVTRAAPGVKPSIQNAQRNLTRVRPHSQNVRGATMPVDGWTRTYQTMKAVYGKGLFSLSFTTPQRVPAIRTTIIRALGQLGIDYREIKRGFYCLVSPTSPIDNASEKHPKIQDIDVLGRYAPSNGLIPISRDGGKHQDSSRQRGASRDQDSPTHKQSGSTGHEEVLFQILVVRVPMLPIHGVQFKHVAGGTEQYQELTHTLSELMMAMQWDNQQ